MLRKLDFRVVVGVKNGISKRTVEAEPPECTFVGDGSVPDAFSIGVVMEIVGTGQNPIGPLVKFQSAGKDPGKSGKLV